MSKINDFLYLGDYGDLSKCQTLNVDTIVTILHFKPTIPPEFNHVYFNAEDDDDFEINKYFDEFIKIVETNEHDSKITFVHCYSGVSRSATLILAYLINKNASKNLSKRCTVKSVLASLRKKRPCVDPNNGFLSQLETYSDTKIKEIALKKSLLKSTNQNK